MKKSMYLAEGKDEMAQMGHEFNDMMGQLESNYQKAGTVRFQRFA